MECEKLTKGISPNDPRYKEKNIEKSNKLDKIKFNLFVVYYNESMASLAKTINKDNLFGGELLFNSITNTRTIAEIIRATEHNNNIVYSAQHFFFCEWECGKKYENNMKEFIETEFLEYFTKQILNIIENTNLEYIETYIEECGEKVFNIITSKDKYQGLVDLFKEENEEETKITQETVIEEATNVADTKKKDVINLVEENNINKLNSSASSSMKLEDEFNTILSNNIVVRKDDNIDLATSNKVVELEDTLTIAFEKGGEQCFINALKELEMRIRNKFVPDTTPNTSTPHQLWNNKTTTPSTAATSTLSYSLSEEKSINKNDNSSSFEVQPYDALFETLIDKISNTETAEKMCDEMIAKIMAKKEKLNYRTNK